MSDLSLPPIVIPTPERSEEGGTCCPVRFPKIVTVGEGTRRLPKTHHWRSKYLQERGTGPQKQNGARTPCGTSARFSPCLPGDGRREAPDPCLRAESPPTRWSALEVAPTQARFCHKSVRNL